jgi:hypothetical protein
VEEASGAPLFLSWQRASHGRDLRWSCRWWTFAQHLHTMLRAAITAVLAGTGELCPLVPLGDAQHGVSISPRDLEVLMLLAVAAVLAVLWLLGVVAFHVTAFAIHVLLIIAIVALIVHFVGGRSRSRV